MTDCYRCGLMIQGQAVRRKEEVRHIVRSDGEEETHHGWVFICKKCVRLENWAKAKLMARNAMFVILGAKRNAVFVILGALALAWLLIKIDPLSSLEARSRETTAVTAVAPMITAQKPRLIPPEDRGARWGR